MSIRMLAVELYCVKTLVAELEKKLSASEASAAQSMELEQKLRVARAEEVRLRSMLEGAKEPWSSS